MGDVRSAQPTHSRHVLSRFDGSTHPPLSVT